MKFFDGSDEDFYGDKRWRQSIKSFITYYHFKILKFDWLSGHAWPFSPKMVLTPYITLFGYVWIQLSAYKN